MKASMKVKDEDIKKLFEGLSIPDKIQALRDSANIIITSTQVGYVKRISPDGKKWAKNPEWYSMMKGKAAPLTGPTSSTVKGGKFAKGYEFAHFNRRRMKNSLLAKIDGSTKATIYYERSVVDRATLTQKGGDSKMILKSKAGGKNIEFNIKVRKRPHLGISTKFKRLGSKTDSDHITDIFGGLISKSIGE